MLKLVILCSLTVAALSAVVPCPLPLCVQCDPGYEFVLVKDENSCEQCHCKPTCELKDCGPKKQCVLQEVQCVTTPCFPQPTCVYKCKGCQVWKQCTSHCPPTCENPNPVCIESCAPAGCECPTNKPIWSSQQQKCIDEQHCEKCKGGMVWKECGSHCTPTCQNPRPFCLLSCAPPRCQCPPNRPIWSEQGQKCITDNQCQHYS